MEKTPTFSDPNDGVLSWARCPTDAVTQLQEQTEEQPGWSLNRADTQTNTHHTLFWGSHSGTFRHMKHDFIIQWMFSQYYLFNTDSFFLLQK